MRESGAPSPSVCFGLSSSVLYNKIDAPIELSSRSLSRGRSVLNKSALKKPKTPPPSLDILDTSISSLDDNTCSTFGDEVIYPPSCPVARLRPTKEVELDISKLWYQEERTEKPLSPRSILRLARSEDSESSRQPKASTSLIQREIEERFNRSRKSVADIVSKASSPSSFDSVMVEVVSPRRCPPPSSTPVRASGIGQPIADDDDGMIGLVSTTSSSSLSVEAHDWGNLASEIANTFSD